ncbi:MAG: TrkA family potassium uptake protein [Candidatus Latescibacterota bacterium]|jgi:trk system potassium uptake protein
MLSKKSLYVVIVGCGRLGSFLANRMSSEGHGVVVIDNDETSFNALTLDYSGFKLVGDADEFAVLKKGRIDQADMVIAVTRDDNSNLMVSQIAKNIFHVPRVIARILDPKRGEIYRNLGIEIVCPTLIEYDYFTKLLEKPLSESGKGNEL